MADNLLLFPEDSSPVKKRGRFFVFYGYSPEQLFERTAGEPVGRMVEQALWAIGFSGQSDDRAALVCRIQERLIEKFLDEPEFASSLAFSQKRKEVVNALIRSWIA